MKGKAKKKTKENARACVRERESEREREGEESFRGEETTIKSAECVSWRLIISFGRHVILRVITFSRSVMMIFEFLFFRKIES